MKTSVDSNSWRYSTAFHFAVGEADANVKSGATRVVSWGNPDERRALTLSCISKAAWRQLYGCEAVAVDSHKDRSPATMPSKSWRVRGA